MFILNDTTCDTTIYEYIPVFKKCWKWNCKYETSLQQLIVNWNFKLKNDQK